MCEQLRIMPGRDEKVQVFVIFIIVIEIYLNVLWMQAGIKLASHSYN